MAYIFNDTQMAEFKRLVARYPEGKQKSALLPVLHLAQEIAPMTHKATDLRFQGAQIVLAWSLKEGNCRRCIFLGHSH
ncbi:MAG: hypothetical protein RIQ51_341 [Bacteroidota bacterium]